MVNQETATLSPCHDAKIFASLSDGVLVGSCSVCGEDIYRINPTTGKPELLEGRSPWTKQELVPLEER